MAAVIYCDRCGLASATDAQFCQRCGNSLWSRPSVIAVPAVTSVLAAPTGPRYAGFWVRTLAFFLDWLLLSMAGYASLPMVGSALAFAHMRLGVPVPGRLARISAALAIAWIYRAGMESSRFQATVGKAILQLKVTDLAGRAISFSQASFRHICRSLVGGLTLGIGLAVAGFDLRKRGLHDKLAGTLVLYR